MVFQPPTLDAGKTKLKKKKMKRARTASFTRWLNTVSGVAGNRAVSNHTHSSNRKYSPSARRKRTLILSRQNSHPSIESWDNQTATNAKKNEKKREREKAEERLKIRL